MKAESKFLWQPLSSPQACSTDAETEGREVKGPPMAILLDAGA